MTHAWRIPLVMLMALALGAGASFLFGDAPASVSARPPVLLDWKMPQLATLDFAVLDAQWKESPPWPAPPPPPPAAEQATAAEEAVPPAPVGIAKGRRAYEAIFSVPGAGELRLLPGDRLPDGGRVLKVSRLSIEWVDGKGERHEHQMFNTYHIPEATPANGTSRQNAGSDAARSSRRAR